MKIFSLIFLFVVALCSGFQLAVAAQQDNLDRYLQQRMELEQIPSLSIAVIDGKGGVTFYNYGYADPETERRADEHTLYEIGSITKTFTASLYLMLAETYGFDSDTPFNELMGEHGLQLPETGDTPITLEHMMTHHSGLPRLPGNMEPADSGDPYKDYSTRLLLAFAGDVQPEREPGEAMEYSNFAYMLLGYAAGEITGVPYDDLVRQYITGPLEMDDTKRVLSDEQQERFARPSAFGQPVSAWHFDDLRGLGELRSSASDMARYLKAHAGHYDENRWEVLKEGHMVRAETPGGYKIAYGWFIDSLEDGSDHVVGHGGGTGGFRSYAGFSPVTGRAAVVLTNSVSDVGDITLHLINEDFELNSLPEAGELDEDIVAGLLGLYRHPDIGVMTISERNGMITGQLQGQPPLPLEHEEGLKFRNRQVAAGIEFEWSDDRAIALMLRQAGGEYRFEQIDEMPEGPQKVEMSREELAEYEGGYDSDMGLSYTIEAREGYLSARLSGQPAAEVFPEGNDRFFYEVVVATLQFQRNEDGKVTAVVLHQGGQELRFDRR